jgi:prepilin-type N-terminal cleavage/methylation domain-containing protein
MKYSRIRRSCAKGFTLAELMVAMSITLVLVLLTLLITGTAIDTWKAARTEIRAAGQAKVMLNSLGRDLESMVSRLGNNNSQWLLATTTPEGVGPEGQKSPNAARLIFFTSASDRYNGNAGSRERLSSASGGSQNADLGGDISAVSYQLDFLDPVFGNPNQKFHTFVLYRNLLDPRETYDRSMLGRQNLETAFDASAGANELADLVCENVFEFTVTFVIDYRDNTGVNRTTKITVMTSDEGLGTVRNFAVNGTGLAPNLNTRSEFVGGRITAVELAITVLTDEGVAILKKNPFGGNPGANNRFIEQNSYRYTRSVTIPQG